MFDEPILRGKSGFNCFVTFETDRVRQEFGGIRTHEQEYNA